MAESTNPGTIPPPDGASVEAVLVRVLDELPDAILLFDANWRIVYANQVARQISRIQPENLNRETLWELYPEIVGTNLEQAYHEVAATGVAQTIEAYFYEPFATWFEICILRTAGRVVAHCRDVTAIHQAEVAEVAAGEQLQQVFDATNDAVATLNREWRFTFVNRKAKEFVRTSGEVLGTHIWERFPAMDYEGSPFLEHYRRAMNEGIAGEFEAPYPAPLNLWLHVVVRPLKNGIILFFRDITARKLHEDALRASEERYRVLTELNPQALWTADARGLVFYANQRFLEYIGKDFVPEDGTEYLQCFAECDRERVLQVWSRSVATGEEYVIDARLLRASDGAARWWHLRALPIRNEAGAIEQWLGVATDVHENRIAADLLREQYTEIERQRRELEAIYRGSPIGMSLYEPKELRLVRLNDRQSDIFGQRAEDALGKSIEELTPGLTDAHDMIRRAAQGERTINREVEGVLPARPGEHRYWNVNYSPIFADNGRVQAIAGATIEITQQKRAERALLQAEKLAAVGRLASSIAHEINNPLESVINLIYLARQYAVLPDVQRLLDAADEELRRVSMIATQTLRFHKQATRPQAVSCSDLFSTVLSIYEGRLKNSDITVEKRKRANQPVVCFEADIRQVLSNLIGNAIDAMPGGGRLVVRSRETTDWKTGRRGFALTVADTGSGIDAETRARIFEAFFTTKGFGGTGLGLWISAEIMERHHGRLRVRSSQQEGHRGTVVTLFLPAEMTTQ
jgi:PAS domain S-box-containing protein